MHGWIPVSAPELADFLALRPGPFPVLPIIASILAAAYLAGAIRLRRRGRRWSSWRTVVFLCGCAVLATTTGLAVEAYGYAMLSVFMFQQLTLMMVVSPLLVLGSPGTLLLRAMPHRGLGGMLLRIAHRGLRSTVARCLLSTWLALPLYLAAFYGLYLAGFADGVLAVPGGHIAAETGFLVIGILFAVPILSSDPLPIRIGHGVRALDVFAEAALHAFFGVFLMMATDTLVTSFAGPTAALGVDPLEDQRQAGALAWSYGEAPTLLVLVYIMHRWFREDSARAAAADRYADIHGDPALDAYNAALEKLHEHDGVRRSHGDDGAETRR